ncbi:MULTISPECIES: ATP-binding cassette domain-containing protein [unclassified Sphingobacterium]|uniref:ABC transporter ATP-binding protein n=1 Tax=unclassified Sphingobacterium TaxID=2609468 RepID=UPI0025E0A8ED|nr:MULTISPECIES: ATP-binding cassette domain-containing protein [unclassified Sphingobacterium]
MISIQQLTKSFGKFKALKGIDLTLNGGECVALIGPNGSGKTTLIKSILGMVMPSAGRITFEGQDIGQQWVYRNHIGYMPQIGQYPENMSIKQVLDMIKDIRKQPQTDSDLYQAFGVDKLLEKRMATLSGGTRQKVSACIAFMFDPKVLILDEPTAGLDPLSTEILKGKIKKEIGRGKLIIISSHVLSDLDEFVSQIVFLQEGELKFHKSLQQLKEDTGTEKLSKAIAYLMQNRDLPN